MAQLTELSKREREVVGLLLQGKSNKLIAAALGISVRTVEFHLQNVYVKQGVGSRMELVLQLRTSAVTAEINHLRSSTVARLEENAENGGKSGQRTAGASSFIETIAMIGKEVRLNAHLTSRHVQLGTATAVLTGAAWVALMKRFGNITISPIPWWLPSLALVLILLGAFLGALGKTNGSSLRRVFTSTLFATGLSPFAIMPVVLITVYPLGKLVEWLGLIDRATLPGELASNIVTAAMLGIWLIIGSAIGAILLFVTIGKPAQPELKSPASRHAL